MNDASEEPTQEKAKRKPPARRAAEPKPKTPETQPEPPVVAQSLAGKLAEVQLAIDRVPRSGHAVVALTGGGRYEYSYPTENDLMAAVRGELAKRGVAVLVSWDKVDQQGTLSTVYGSLMFTDGKEQYHIGMIGTGADRGDKGIYKAMTGAMRYSLWKTFLIPTGDEPDADHQEAAPVSPAQAAKPSTNKLAVGHRQSIRAVLLKIDEAEGKKAGESERAWSENACKRYAVEIWSDISADQGDHIVEALGRRLHESQVAAAEKAAAAVTAAEPAPAGETGSPGVAGPQEGAGDAAEDEVPFT